MSLADHEKHTGYSFARCCLKDADFLAFYLLDSLCSSNPFLLSFLAQAIHMQMRRVNLIFLFNSNQIKVENRINTSSYPPKQTY